MDYPSFENPSLVEALCEIRFQPISDEISQRMLGILVPILLDKYPLSDVINESSLKLNLGGQQLAHSNNRHKFSSDKHSYVITVKRDSFSFSIIPNQLTKYKKENFYDSLCFEWDRISKALGVNNITRIGIRFINKLHAVNVLNNSDFFSMNSDYIPKCGLNKAPNFVNRNEIQMDTTNRFIVTSGSNLIQGNEESKREFLLDIDRIVEGENFSKEAIKDKLVNLHKDIEKVFFSSITEAYKEKMK